MNPRRLTAATACQHPLRAAESPGGKQDPDSSSGVPASPHSSVRMICPETALRNRDPYPERHPNLNMLTIVHYLGYDLQHRRGGETGRFDEYIRFPLEERNYRHTGRRRRGECSESCWLWPRRPHCSRLLRTGPIEAGARSLRVAVRCEVRHRCRTMARRSV